MAKQRTARVGDLVNVVHALAPPSLAESWDSVGLQTGDPSGPAARVLVALEVSGATIAEAVRSKCTAMVTHHPLIFRPFANLVPDSPAKRFAMELVRRRMALVAAHTNYDSIPNGTNGEIADRIGLKPDRQPLYPADVPSGARSKYVVFVPADRAGAVIEAAARAGAGVIGNYSHCSFRTPGTGTYRPLDGANPFAGSVGKLEHADGEVRLEVVCATRDALKLHEAVCAVHPYEEVAFDLYPLQPLPGADGFGLGTIGDLQKTMTLAQLGRLCAARFPSPGIRLVGEPRRRVRRVAICSGSGGTEARGWERLGADVLVTGEMTHHDCCEMRDRGGSAVLLGHYASEAVAMARLARSLEEGFAALNLRCEVFASNENADPIRVL